MTVALVGLDSSTSSSSTINGVFDDGVAAGHSLVVLAANNDKRGANVPTSTSLTFTERADGSGASIADDIDLAAAKSISDTVTQTFSGNAGRLIALFEFDGIATFRTATQASGNSSTPSISRGTSDGVAAGDDVLGIVAHENASAISTPSGWTEIFQQALGSWRVAAHKKEGVTAATQTYNPVGTSGADYAIAMAVYAPPAGGGGGPAIVPIVQHLRQQMRAA